MNNPLISIIVPIFNVQRYLTHCLDSLITQTMKEIEIICVNDGSKDNSLSILNEYAAKDDRFIVIEQKNSGVSIARNNALKHVHGEYYMFLDSDDWLDADTCEVAYKYAVKNRADCLMFSYTKEFSDHSIVNNIFSNDYFVWQKDDVLNKFHRRLFGPIGDELARPQDGDIIVSPCMQLFKSNKYKNISFIDIREIGNFEDGLYQMVVYKDCNTFVYIDKPFYHYRKTNTGSITTKYNPQLFIKWQHLYDIILNYINEWGLYGEYQNALTNRIALGVLVLGLNQIRSGDSILRGSNNLRMMLSVKRYDNALSQLNTKVMSLPWKIFFFLAKRKFTFSLFVMLKLIEYLRIHKK